MRSRPSLVSTISLLFLLSCPPLISSDPFVDFDMDTASASELEEYRNHLTRQLKKVTEHVEKAAFIKRKKLSPLSASLPNRESSFFLDRIQLLSTTKPENGEEQQREEKLLELLNSIDDLQFENKTEETDNEEPSTTVLPSTVSPSPSSSTSPDSSSTTSPTPSSNSPDPLPSPQSVPSIASPSSPSLSSHPSHSPLTSPSSDGVPSSSIVTEGPSPSEEKVEGMEEREERREPLPHPRKRTSFNPTVNHTIEECRHLTQQELVRELKQKGTYNPDLMAWDVFGILRFLDRTITDQYEMQMRNRSRSEEAAERNVEALARILGELDVPCDVQSERVKEKMHNLTMTEPRRSVSSPSLRRRSKREAAAELSRLVEELAERKAQATTPPSSSSSTTTTAPIYENIGIRQKLIACQAIRRLPDSFFPPFINEVTCDEDNACLYFYDYPHGRCRQKHMNFVVLRNIGTPECQVWRKFNLNVRVSCECFVDEMSFFAKYV